MRRIIVLLGALSAFFAVIVPGSARAADTYTQRLQFEAGVEWYGNPTSSALVLGAEYEYRFQPTLGVGGLLEYRFSSPGLTRVGLPVYWHPTGDDWLLLAAPLAEVSSSTTHFGARVGAWVPIPLGGGLSFLIAPAVDFVDGTQAYIFGFGLMF